MINNFSRVLCALLLCAGFVFSGCTEGPLGDDQNTELGGNASSESENDGGDNGGSQDNLTDDENENGLGDNDDSHDKPADKDMVGPATVKVGNKTAKTVTFDVHMDVPAEELPYCIVTIYYTDQDALYISTANSVYGPYVDPVSGTSGTSGRYFYFDENQEMSIQLINLEINATYKYCVCVETKTYKVFSDVMEFTPEIVTMDWTVEPDIYSAVVKGSIIGLSPKDKSYLSSSSIDFRYYTEGSDYKSTYIYLDNLSDDNTFEFELQNLSPGTTYTCAPYYCGSNPLASSMSFSTLKSPYDTSQNLNVSSAMDLSSSTSANCYIVSNSGLYKFKTVKGNSTESVGSVASASILWETFGTSTTPECFDLIKAVDYENGYIAFQTAYAFKEGNAVIAAKDANGTILWSWHIWLTDQPLGQVYYNNAGTMMDRNLGATSATPGDVGAIGLLYQWGRKDPFLGSSSISSNTVAKSTIVWPSTVSSNSNTGTITYTTANPTTFITYNNSNYDWYYTGSSSTDNTRWTTSESNKSIYDPCPAGWRVPDGGDNGVWSKALGSSDNFSGYAYDSTNKGMNFSSKLGSASIIWYPTSGCRDYRNGSLYFVANSGVYWSSSYNSCDAYELTFDYMSRVFPSHYDRRSFGQHVRCLQVID